MGLESKTVLNEDDDYHDYGYKDAFGRYSRCHIRTRLSKNKESDLCSDGEIFNNDTKRLQKVSARLFFSSRIRVEKFHFLRSAADEYFHFTIWTGS